MSKTVFNMLINLKPDSWRDEASFSADIESAQKTLFDPVNEDESVIEVLKKWLGKNQPCLFGRIAARLGLLSYCILRDSDLEKTDEEIRDKIQKARSCWKREGFEGKKSGFIIAVISERIAKAVPDDNVKQLAKKLLELHLRQDEINTDQIYLDRIYLEIPSFDRRTYAWPTGVNYFSAQGDKRWWHDHRIPGGIAFSINSVAHMVRSENLAKAQQEILSLFPEESEGWKPTKIDSLEKALDFAMRTIHIASDTISGKATQLLPLPQDKSLLPVRKCPVELPQFLSDKNFCNYEGFYHTDITLPSEYFIDAIERPKEIQRHTLDFTYLFDDAIDNPDFDTMGRGERIRAGAFPDDKSGNGLNFIERQGKMLRRHGEIVSIDECEDLLWALGEDL